MLYVLYHNKKKYCCKWCKYKSIKPFFPHPLLLLLPLLTSNNIPSWPNVPPTHHLPWHIPRCPHTSWLVIKMDQARKCQRECDLLYRISLAFYRAENQEACEAVNLAQSPVSWSKPFSSPDLLSIKIGRWPRWSLRSFSSENLKVPWFDWQETGEKSLCYIFNSIPPPLFFWFV